MKVLETALPGVLLLEPPAFSDARGQFFESYNRRTLADLGLAVDFVQDNHSISTRAVLRGLHYQIQQPQGKLVRVVAGEVFDVAVDIRRSSPTFGKWVGVILSEQNKAQFWVPPGFAHGFVALEDSVFSYKCSNIYNKEAEGGVIWNDKDLNIDWGFSNPLISEKDMILPAFKDLVY